MANGRWNGRRWMMQTRLARWLLEWTRGWFQRLTTVRTDGAPAEKLNVRQFSTEHAARCIFFEHDAIFVNKYLHEISPLNAKRIS